ncbi:MAG: hypothetical protein IKJ65_05935 [Clostridia bacterium]|nr:hypothetical protein [Clostridia bacterium]
MTKFIDIHHHVAYGIDDGARNIECSKQMIDASHEAGICEIISTPHVQPGRKAFDYEKYLGIIDELNQYCIQKDYDIKVIPGAEIMYTDAATRLLNEGYIPTLNQSRFVLVEWKNPVNYDAFVQNIRDLINAGYTPVIAHIERYKNLWFAAKRIQQLKSMFDIRIQVDCEVFLERAPLLAKLFVDKLMKMRLVDYLATDAHNVSDRGVNMKDAYEVVNKKYGSDYAKELTYENQLEILEAELP